MSECDKTEVYLSKLAKMSEFRHIFSRATLWVDIAKEIYGNQTRHYIIRDKEKEVFMFVVLQAETDKADVLAKRLSSAEPAKNKNWLLKNRGQLYGRKVDVELLPVINEIILGEDPTAIIRTTKW